MLKKMVDFIIYTPLVTIVVFNTTVKNNVPNIFRMITFCNCFSEQVNDNNTKYDRKSI